MFRQEKSEDQEVYRLSEVATIIHDEEEKIDFNEKLILMTWSPDPAQLPDCDFTNQHIFAIQYIITYLQTCKCGVACVEATEAGNPHYHLWYQHSNDYFHERARIKWIKILRRVGNVKITSDVRHVKLNRYHKVGNALWYYKKEAATLQLYTPYNPVCGTTPPPVIDYTDYNMFFHVEGRKTSRSILEKVSQMKQLDKFYNKSI